MIAIVGNHRHGGSTFLSRHCDENGTLVCIKKSASNSSGILSLLNEISGLSWYNNTKSRDKIPFRVDSQLVGYCSIAILPLRSYKKIPLKRGYIYNAKLISSLVSHYCHVWGNSRSLSPEFTPFHGDLSLVGNVLFDDQLEPLFIDWEHFSYAGAPIGFDAVSCVFEMLLYEMTLNGGIASNSLRHAGNMLLLLRGQGLLADVFSNNPLRGLLTFMNDNRNLWAGQYYKIPILKYTDDQIAWLDNEINKAMTLSF